MVLSQISPRVKMTHMFYLTSELLQSNTLSPRQAKEKCFHEMKRNARHSSSALIRAESTRAQLNLIGLNSVGSVE